MSSAGGSQKKRKAEVPKESADTHEYESCQQNDVDVDMDEKKEELRFVLGKRFGGMARTQKSGATGVRHRVDNGGRRQRAAQKSTSACIVTT